MKIEEHHIDQYVMGKLSPSERSAFTKELQGNNELQKEVQQRRQIVSGLAKLQQKMTRDKMRAFAERQATAASSPEAKVVTMRSSRRWLAVAASVLMIAAAAFWLLNDSSPSHSDIFASVYQLPSYETIVASTTVKGNGTDDKKEAWEVQVESAFRSKKITEAIQIIEGNSFENLSKEKQVQYFTLLGVLYLENKQFQKAKETFAQPVLQSYPTTQWYQALVLLETDATNQELKAAFIQVQPPFAKKAQEILKKLE